MAIIHYGVTRCALCRELISADREYEAFMCFLVDEKDPMYPLSDGAAHKVCFDAWPLKSEFIARHEAALEKVRQLGQEIDRARRSAFVKWATDNGRLTTDD